MKQCKEEFYSRYCSPKVGGVVKSLKMGGTGIGRGLHMPEKMRNVYIIFVEVLTARDDLGD